MRRDAQPVSRVRCIFIYYFAAGTRRSKVYVFELLNSGESKAPGSRDKILKLAILLRLYTVRMRPCAHTNGESQSLGHPQKSKFISFITDGTGRELSDISAARRGA